MFMYTYIYGGVCLYMIYLPKLTLSSQRPIILISFDSLIVLVNMHNEMNAYNNYQKNPSFSKYFPSFSNFQAYAML